MTTSTAEAPALKPEVGRAVRLEAPDADGIGRIVIDRPDDSVNAVNPSLVEDLAAAVRAARGTENLRGLIVASGKASQFVAGADLKMVGRATDPTDLEGVSRRFQAVLDELAWLPCTTVAAINGPALGGGLELALACDYRLMVDDARSTIGQTETSLGLIPGAGGTQRLPRLIGRTLATEMIFESTRLKAPEAAAIGLINAALPAEGFQAAVLERARRLAQAAPIALRLAKEALLAGLERPPGKGYEVEAENFGRAAMTEDAMVGIMSFVSKQQPDFKGK